MKEIEKFIRDQLSVWPIAAANFRALKSVQVKEMTVCGTQCRVQFNPCRIASSTADTSPEAIAAKAGRIRAMMDKYGYADCESLLNEWNYVKGWTDDWPYSLEVERGAFNQKGAAFVAATMIDCQVAAPLDHLMYYDARPFGMNGMFS